MTLPSRRAILPRSLEDTAEFTDSLVALGRPTLGDPLQRSERPRFPTQETYRDLTDEPGVELSPDESQFTLQAFTDGYVARVIVDDHGALVTTDPIHSGGPRPAGRTDDTTVPEQISTPSRSSPSRYVES